MKLIHAAVVALLFATLPATAQSRLTGKVYDQVTKEPLVGAVICIPGTTTGTVTGNNGRFHLESEATIDSVRISYVGYIAQLINISSDSITIALEPRTHSLQPVTVTASRDGQERKDIPASVNSIAPEVIRETNPTQLNQVLNKIPGLVMKDLNNEQHMMSIRQPMTSRPYFLYLEDGLPIAPVGNFNHNQLIEVNMLGIRTVEVMKGPASSVYGSNAVGGAINFITQSPSMLPMGRVGYQMNNYGYQRVEFFASNHLSPKFGLSVGGYMARQRDGWQTYSDFDKLSLSAKAVYYVNAKNDLTFYFTHNSLNTQTGGSIDSAGFYSRKFMANNNFCYREVNGMRARVTWNRYWNAGSKTNVTAYFGQSVIGQNPRYRIKNVNSEWAKGEENEDGYRNYGLLLQHVQSFGFLHSKLTAGLTGNIAPTHYESMYGIITRDATTGYYTSFTATDSALADYNTLLFGAGGYLQYEITPVKNMKVVAGLRYDRLSYGYDNQLSSQAFSGVADTTVMNSAWSPKIGMTYDLGNNSGVYVNFSRGFAPPQVSDLFFGTKLPVLKPASFLNYEAGGWAELIKGRLYAEVCVYRLEGVNEIIAFRLADNSTENRNSGRTLHQGMEYSLTYKPVQDILFRIGGTNAVHKYIQYDVQQTAGGELVSYAGNFMAEAPAFIMNAELMIKPHFVKGLRLGLEWQGIGPWYKNDANTARYEDRTFLLKGVSLLHLRCGYRYKNMEIYTNITNLTNELYANSVTRNASNKDTFAAGAPRVVAFGFVCHFEGKTE